MSVQTPQEPGRYPTAPPWANSPEQMPAAPAPHETPAWATGPGPAPAAPSPHEAPPWAGGPATSLASSSSPEAPPWANSPETATHEAPPWANPPETTATHEAPPWANPPETAATHEAPPWANPPETAAGHEVGQRFPEYRHGQLLVRFPGEVHASARPEAPSWRPVAVWTFFFSALGVISALRRSATSRHYGRARRPYWIAFGTTLVAGAAFWSLLAVNVVIPYYHQWQEDKITTVVQDSLLGDRRIIKKHGAVKSVACRPETERDADDLRTYLCTFQLATGKSSGMYVTADPLGNWLEKE